MMFVQAFLVGGLLCAIFQTALMFTKIGVPRLLIIGLALGGLGSAFGLCDMLSAFGGAGFSVMVVGAAWASGRHFPPEGTRTPPLRHLPGRPDPP